METLIRNADGETQLAASVAASYLYEATATALAITAPAAPCRLDFVPDTAADFAAGSLIGAVPSPRAGDSARDQMTRVNVYLDPAQAAKAKVLGCGNLSDGIKAALTTRTLN